MLAFEDPPWGAALLALDPAAFVWTVFARDFPGGGPLGGPPGLEEVGGGPLGGPPTFTVFWRVTKFCYFQPSSAVVAIFCCKLVAISVVRPIAGAFRFDEVWVTCVSSKGFSPLSFLFVSSFYTFCIISSSKASGSFSLSAAIISSSIFSRSSLLFRLIACIMRFRSPGAKSSNELGSYFNFSKSISSRLISVPFLG